MRNRLKPCQPISIFTRLLLLGAVLSLTACLGKTEAPEVVHPYVVESRGIELQATNSVQLGNYRQALRLYKRAYDAYSALDDRPAMARQLINLAQLSLIIEDLDQAQTSIDLLGEHIKLYQASELAPRWKLLSANLAIAEDHWQTALDLLQDFADNSAQNVTQESAQVSRAIALWGLEETAPTQQGKLNSPLSRARLARLNAQVALKENDLGIADQQLLAAKQLYQAAAFVPGIAECLIIEAKLAETKGQTETAQRFKERAKNIFKRIGNQRAIQRHSL